ncbi:transcription factor bHLH115-like [Phoenix dactylifera]|uniref:Transcription factor bHLH115-like n=1 Tax=Phoenix dactylifera TaxID=42345 RepID=A0A8B7CPR1_PHODC|nr:transcription factor bHLH115-like [Phoenix dactylifera]
MGSNAIEDYWIDGGGSDGELRCALESFCEMAPTAGVRIEEAYRDASGLEQASLRKRMRDESCAGPKSKACREKIRRDRLNDRFLELSAILDPGRHPKFDKASILSDAARLLVQLRSEAQQLKESNEKLQETIKDLKVEKNELREEKMRLKADKERLEQQIKVMSVPPAGFMPHPIAYHPTAATVAFAPHGQAPPSKCAPFTAFPGVAMWKWLPPPVVDTTQDTKLWPPNA